MKEWRSYSWTDFPGEVPWKATTEVPVMPSRMNRTDPRIRPDFDPAHTYYAVLKYEWRIHPAGSRVIITPTIVAIEIAEGFPEDAAD